MTTTLDQKRFRAAVLIRDTTMLDAANAGDVSLAHLYYVIKGERVPSQKLLRLLRNFFGEETWKWIVHETEVLLEKAG